MSNTSKKATKEQAAQSTINITVPEKMRSGVYANAVSVTINDNEVIIDMGYILPNVKPTNIEVVSRVNMSHRTAEQFVSILQNSILDYRSRRNQKQTA